MNSWDVRMARIRTLAIVVKELDWLDELQIEALVQAVADDRYVQERAKAAFIAQAFIIIEEENQS